MNALILAAGKGERLIEVTKVTPKPMIIFGGKPILQYNIEMCKIFGIKNLFINTHHYSEQITSYFKDGTEFGVNISYAIETELLGTSGAINNFIEYFTDEPFFVIYGDQFSDFNLTSLIEKYNMHESMGVIAFHHREEVIHSGVAEFDENLRIKQFIEKPKTGETESHWVNAGIYYLNPRILDYIPDGFSDFGRQIFPELLRLGLPLHGICENKEVKVFDTPEMYNKSFSK